MRLRVTELTMTGMAILMILGVGILAIGIMIRWMTMVMEPMFLEPQQQWVITIKVLPE